MTWTEGSNRSVLIYIKGFVLLKNKHESPIMIDPYTEWFNVTDLFTLETSFECGNRMTVFVTLSLTWSNYDLQVKQEDTYHTMVNTSNAESSGVRVNSTSL